MSLQVALNNALSGLHVSQQALTAISQNIANVNTEGYSRQIVEQSPVYIGDSAPAGVKLEDVVRKVDKYLQRSIRDLGSDVGSATVIKDYFDRMQILFGDPGSENSIDSYVEKMFEAFQSLADNPNTSSLRYTAVNSAQRFADQLANLALNTEDLRYQADQDIDEAVRKVNNDLDELYSVNLAINNAFALGNSTAGLLDRRDLILKDLTSYMDAKVFFTNTGAVHVFVGNGISLVDENRYQISYTPAPSVDTFIGDGNLKAMTVAAVDAHGNVVGTNQELVSAGSEEGITTILNSGKIRGLLDLRDRLLPDVLAQLDQLAYTMTNEFNKIHNDGAGFPPATQLTGTRALPLTSESTWSGSVQIAILQQDGMAPDSPYDDELGGFRPLTLDLSTINSGNGAGQPNLEDIIKELNIYFGPPQTRGDLGNMNSIAIASLDDTIGGGTFNFDLDLENISTTDSSIFINGFTVEDDTAAVIDAQTPNVATLGPNPFDTAIIGTTTVTVTHAAHGYQNGDKIYINGVGPGAVNGIPASDFNTVFTISNVTANSYDIVVASPAGAVGPAGGAGPITVTPMLDEIDPGVRRRTGSGAAFAADFSGNAGSAYYTITLDVTTWDNSTGTPSNGTISYRVDNNIVAGALNNRYYANAATGAATVVIPNTSQRFATAELVDAKGNKVSNINEDGYLRITTNGLGSDGKRLVIAINELDSSENGLPAEFPPVKGTSRGFSDYFQLNDFFVRQSSETEGSAVNLMVREDILANPNLLSTGELTLSHQPTNPGGAPLALWTYELGSGGNQVIHRLAALANLNVVFDASGSLPAVQLTMGGYAAEILGFNAAQAVATQGQLNQNQSLLDGFTTRSDAISGVNLDEELANTVIYQNAYSANAKVITVTDTLFQTLLNSFGG